MSEGGDDVWRLANVAKGRDVKMGRGGGKGRPPSLSASAKSRLARIVAKRPEVMVKITGRTRGAVHLKAHLDYISRNAKLEVERSDGSIIRDRSAMRILHDDWLQTNSVMAKGRNNPQAVQSVSVILSMPPGHPPDKVQAAARTWARETFADQHEWIMARHDDKDHPHVHVTVRAVGADGRRLTAGPKELQTWRERFARELRRYGVEAEATPRQARGVVRKADPIAVHKVERKGSKPWVKREAERDAGRDAASPVVRSSHAWEAAIENRQDRIKRTYLAHAAALNASDDPADRRLAADVQRFVAGLPIANTRRQALAAELRAVWHDRQQDAAERTKTPSLSTPEPDIPKPERLSPKRRR